MNDIQCKIHNKFEFEIIDGKTGEVKRKARAFNVVTNNLWSYLINSNTAFATYIQYGSGSGTPSASDTSLFNRSGGVGVSEISLSVDYVNKLITRVCRIVLGLTDAVGITITEVGMGAGADNGSLTTHAMLQDMNGNPITITKTDTDIINIYATIYCHWNVDSCVVFHPEGNLVSSLSGASNIFGNLTMGVSLGLFEVYNSKTFTKNSDLSNKKIVYTLPRYSQSEGNIGGVVSLLGTGSYNGVAIKQGSVSWNKFSVTNESVGTGDGETVKFKTKFHYPENAKVYLNGTLQSNVQVLKRRNNNSANIIPLDNISTDERLVYSPLQSNANKKQIYNADYENIGLYRVDVSSSSSFATASLYASNDLVNWTRVAYGERVGYYTTYLIVPEEYRHYKYFKPDVGGDVGSAGNFTNDFDGYNIIFDTPPAVGDVITITYDTACIPKDSDHVLDATVTFQFGEYNE